MDQVYKSFFDSDIAPARVTVEAKSPIKGIKVEIEAIAIKKKKEKI